MAGDREEKIAYTKKLLAEGTSRVPEIQKAVKAKFGTGISFRDLGSVFPKKPGAKKKAAKRGPGRPRKKAGRKPGPKPGRRPGRPKGWSSDQYLLMVGEVCEVFGGKRALESRVAELIAEGHAADDLAVYEKSSMQLTLKTTVTL
jgi:hypothetical protein